MSFSALGSLGSHVLVKNFYEKTIKFPSLNEKERISLNIMHSKFKPCRRISLCRSELVDFEKRTSPDEVIPVDISSLFSIILVSLCVFCFRFRVLRFFICAICSIANFEHIGFEMKANPNQANSVLISL